MQAMLVWITFSIGKDLWLFRYFCVDMKYSNEKLYCQTVGDGRYVPIPPVSHVQCCLQLSYRDSSDSLTLSFSLGRIQDSQDILGPSLHVPLKKLSMLSGESLGHPGILPSRPPHTAVWRILWTSWGSQDILGSSLHVPLTQLPHSLVPRPCPAFCRLQYRKAWRA